MLLETLQGRVLQFFDGILDRYRSRLPFRGLVIERMRDVLLDTLNFGTVQFYLEDLFTPGGPYSSGVNFLRWWLKGKVRVPVWVRLFVNPDRVIDEVCDHLLEHAPEYKATIGALARQ